MAEKPTYEELERRIQELEKIESEQKYSKEALRETENLFKMLYEKAPLGYQSLDENGHFVVVNQAWLDTLGYDKEEVIGKSFADFLHPGWQAHFKKNFPRFKAIGEVLGVEFEMVKKNGELILVSFTGKISRNKKGDFQQTHCIFHDITERKKAEEALQESEEKYRILFEHTGEALFVVQNGHIVFHNPRTTELTGYSTKEFQSKPFLYFIHEDDCEMVMDNHIRRLRGEKLPERYAFRIIHKNGKILWAELNAVLIQWNGKPAVYCFMSDITEHRRAQKDLQNERAVLKTIINSIPVMITRYDPHIKMLFMNKELEKKIGWKTEELCNIDLMEKVYPDPAYRKLAQEYMEKTAIEWREFTLRSKSGENMISEWSNICLDDGTRIGIGIDVTERKKTEEKYEKLQTQFHQAQKLESVGRLAGGVAHDFNNMLGVILGHTELALLKADEDNDLISDLEEIQTAAKRSADITKQLLAFARKQTISPRQLDLNDTVESMLNMLRRLIGENIDLMWQPAAHLWPVKMDPSQIDQILANLCINARDAIDGVGKLTIETGRKSFDEEYCKEHAGFIPGNFVLLAVSDNGIGMDKDTLANLFEPFFTTKEVGKGTGLGLATIYGIVKQNNGFINVYSELGQGSTFKIYLPRFFPNEDSDKTVPEKKTVASGTETILVVEDEPTILRMTRMMLERNGYSVLSAASPSEAVEKATNHSGSIDLLMSDVIMPEMNGRDLSVQITDLYPGIKLLFMSGYSADVIAHQGILDDGVAFMQKPFSMGDMTEKVRDVLDSSKD